MKAVLFLLSYLVVDLVYVLGSDIFKSVNWALQNALFQADGKSCRRGPRYLKVQLNSKINFVCPNAATVLQKRSTAVQASAMYENLWLLENKTAFENCDRTMDPKARRLLTCSSPGQLTYTSVIFAQFTAEEDGLKFVGGRTYYFIATSDGTESSLNNTFGGHCDDPSMKVNMKIAVYICKKNKGNKQICLLPS
ncbi:ephrin-B1-like [Montipora capricornis]|uniref:ephrin-B1-like n=1 Tax=Montipora capricornis TaxID=246305 RepID=UPI0035F15A44